MEWQVTSLSTKATVLGVTNPKGSYNPRESLAVNTGLSGPLLSRFDLILVLRDSQDPDWDADISEHILTGHQAHHTFKSPDSSSGTLAQVISYTRQLPSMLLGHRQHMRTACTELTHRHKATGGTEQVCG